MLEYLEFLTALLLVQISDNKSPFEIYGVEDFWIRFEDSMFPKNF